MEESKPIEIQTAQEPELILSPEDRQKIEKYKSQIDLSATSKVIQYGLSSQN